ncbi:MAG TPA: hypothetical protein VHE35_33940 [Kofleriaceae bacterium]|nr:hypothetical protein [Kofleriaceae bacterium]
MSTRTSVVRAGVALAVMVAAGATRVAPASADPSPTSPVAQLLVVESGHKDYKSFHGAVWLQEDKATTNYRWGGSQCAGKDVSDSTIQLLFAAFRSGDQVTIDFVPTDIKGKQYRCVTAVTFSKT